MSDRVGTASIYHRRLPNQWRLERMFSGELSKEARIRLRWMDFYRKHENVRLTCRHFGISPTTFYKWLKRFCERGLRGLESLSRAPRRRRSPTVPRQTVSLIVSIRKANPAWSKHKIAVILTRDHGVTVSASTVGRVLKRKGLYDRRVSRKRAKAAKKRQQRLRAEWWMKNAFPGCLIQVDTKHLRFAGKKFYQFTAVDCFSRIAFCRVFSSGSSKCARTFLEELSCYMPFSLVALQTDNGSEFLKHFDKATEEMLVTHYFSHPYCPKENAHVERKIQTTKYELWAFKEAYTVKDLNELVDEWNDTYNNYRPHQSLGYLTPNEFLKSWYDSSKCRDDVSTM